MMNIKDNFFTNPFSIQVMSPSGSLETKELSLETKVFILAISILSGLLGFGVTGLVVFCLLSRSFKEEMVKGLVSEVKETPRQIQITTPRETSTGRNLIKENHPNARFMDKVAAKETTYLKENMTYTFVTFKQEGIELPHRKGSVLLVWKNAEGVESSCFQTLKPSEMGIPGQKSKEELEASGYDFVAVYHN